MTTSQTLPLDRLNMLIVDDEPSILTSLQGLFRRQFNISTAESAESALALIDKQEYFFHVVLSDQRMSGMNGCDLLSKIHEKFEYTTSVLITGYSDINDLIQGVNQGYIFGYITKPWNPKELKALIFKAAEFCQIQLHTNQRINLLKQELKNKEEKLATSKHQFLEFIEVVRVLTPAEQQRIFERLQGVGLSAWEQLPDLIEEIKTLNAM